jgi:hypothetical protein
LNRWIASKISDILGNEDDVVIEMIYNLIEEKRFVGVPFPLPEFAKLIISSRISRKYRSNSLDSLIKILPVSAKNYGSSV